MEVDWGNWLHDTRNTNSHDIIDVWVVSEEDENVAVSRANALNGQSLVVLVQAYMDYFGVTQVVVDSNTADLLCELVSSVVL